MGIPFLVQGVLGLYSSSKYITPPWGNVLLGAIFLFVFGFGWQAVKGYRRTVKDFKENKNAAAKGVKEAQNSLGVNYRDGLGVEQDFKEAVKWFEKAADQGVADAQTNLGIMYVEGLGVEQDFKEAVRWYQKAADQEDLLAQTNLGAMYAEGFGVEQDFKEAVKWFEKAADQGAAMAQDNLGGMYGKGLGVEQNYVTAYTWASIAAFNGFEVAKETTSVIAKEMTSAQIAEAQKLSKEMVEKNPKLISKQQN